MSTEYFTDDGRLVAPCQDCGIVYELWCESCAKRNPEHWKHNSGERVGVVSVVDPKMSRIIGYICRPCLAKRVTA